MRAQAGGVDHLRANARHQGCAHGESFSCRRQRRHVLPAQECRIGARPVSPTQRRCIAGSRAGFCVVPCWASVPRCPRRMPTSPHDAVVMFCHYATRLHLCQEVAACVEGNCMIPQGAHFPGIFASPCHNSAGFATVDTTASTHHPRPPACPQEGSWRVHIDSDYILLYYIIRLRQVKGSDSHDYTRDTQMVGAWRAHAGGTGGVAWRAPPPRGGPPPPPPPPPLRGPPPRGFPPRPPLGRRGRVFRGGAGWAPPPPKKKR